MLSGSRQSDESDSWRLPNAKRPCLVLATNIHPPHTDYPIERKMAMYLSIFLKKRPDRAQDWIG